MTALLNLPPLQLRSIQPVKKRTHYTAVVNWLTKYQAPSDQPNLEQVRGYLEAFHHLCAVADWPRASQILNHRPHATTNRELHAQLFN